MPDPTATPFLTTDFPGIGGAFKVRPEDFRVDELPLYAPSGEGEHTFVRIAKTGIATFEAIRRLAKAVGAKERDVGSAGLKDARAHTTQWLSFQLVDPARFDGLDIAGVEVLEVTRHGNKLRRGHLAGNRFTCVLRGVRSDGEADARAVLGRLSADGLPNHFGNQRFGGSGDTHALGRCLVMNDPEGLLRLMLGRADREPDPRRAEPRAAYDAGDLPRALELTHPRRNQERRLLKMLIESGNNQAQAVKMLPKKLKQLYVSAYQSALFNRLLDDRMPDLRTLQAGDVAWLHRNGASFVVENAATEQPRADAFEISPSGPLIGTKVLLADGDPGQAERDLMAGEGITPESFRLGGGLAQPGARRPYRVPVHDAELAWNDPEPEADGVNATVCFSLGPGSYATNLLAELAKGDQPPIVPET